MSEHCYALTTVRARAEVVVEPGPAADVLRWRSAPPVALRPTGPGQIHLVQAAGGPLGGDDLGLAVRLGSGTSLRVRSAAATVVQPGRPAAAACWTVTADLSEGAVLDWRPEPTVVCDGAELRSSVTVSLRRGARAVLREEVVLGRAGQRGGRFRGELTVELEGIPLLAHTMLLDGVDSALTGPAGTGGARVIGTLVAAGEGIGGPPETAGEQTGLRWACSALDGPGWLLIAVGDRATDVSRLLDHTVSPCNR